MYDSLERDLAAVCGQNEEAAAAYAGRGMGPGFVWKDMCGTPASTRCRSSDVSRAWGLTATWLTQLGHIMRQQTRRREQQLGVGGTGASRTCGTGAPGSKTNSSNDDRDRQKQAGILRWRLLHYCHKFDHVTRDANASSPVVGIVAAAAYAVELKQSMVFKRWKEIMTIHSLRSEFWVGALATVAEQESTTAARRAEAAARTNYQDWLNGGPALGLGRQHRMSRTALGWVPTRVGTTKPWFSFHGIRNPGFSKF